MDAVVASYRVEPEKTATVVSLSLSGLDLTQGTDNTYLIKLLLQKDETS